MIKMTKMQACHALVELQKEVEEQRLRAIDFEKKNPRADVIDPTERMWIRRRREDESQKLERWVKAIEMAGSALTH